MAADGSQQWGITPALSMALPTEKENELNNLLLDELKNRNNFEAKAETDKRAAVLNTLQKVTDAFVRRVGQLRGLPPSVIDNAGGKVHTFGSYRLGVYGPGSDIDTLVVAPKHVSRDDFFEHFPKLLEAMSSPGAIEEITPVPDAHVPIIMLEYSGISVDLIFTRLLLSSVNKDTSLKDNNLLRGMDEVDLRSINGTRVTDEILSLVPQTKTFRLALRAVKLWAQLRGVYGNIVGFPGGVAWAMMVARVCQLYPMANSSTIVHKFFNIMLSWPWPRPVMLKEIEEGPLQVRIWNPMIYHGDRRHIMPIITPMYPAMCATHNVTQSTFKVIKREMLRAKNIMNAITAKKLSWSDLFQRHHFFSEDYKYYLSIVTASPTKEAQLKWSGRVQSKVRMLVASLETSENGVEIAHPFVKGFEREHRCKNDEEKGQVFQGGTAFQVPGTKVETTGELNIIKAESSEIPNSATEKTDDGSISIYTTTFYVGIELREGGRSLDLSTPVLDFKKLCTDWPEYDADLNSLRIVHTRNWQLPDDVFEPGEIKPVKVEKKKKHGQKTSSKASATKRDVATAGLEGSDENNAKRPHPEGNANGILSAAG